MIELFVSEDSSQSTRVSLNNVILYVTLSFSVREQSWYFSLLDVNRVPYVEGVKLQFGVSPTLNIKDSPLDGNLYLFKNTESSETLGRNNLGQGKEYSLVYLTTAEEQTISGQLAV